jgi:hypothetical protein
MQLVTILSLVHVLLFQASFVRSEALTNDPSMRRVKVRTVVPRTLQVGGGAGDVELAKRQRCGETCYDGSCCDVGYYCDVVQGILGCCAIGSVCSEFTVTREGEVCVMTDFVCAALGNSNCVTAGYLECNHYNFCCRMYYCHYFGHLGCTYTCLPVSRHLLVFARSQ